ncbi:MBL fold metallo-hydrolase [Candidatus Micrarchaeota archaeon]|nr:MBL fold metallo-hydrolase [Candidatus Micrarchaeota archaeon]
MQITVLYDNEGDVALKLGWGFSCLVDAHGKRILFDTGDNGDALVFNMEKLSVDIPSIDALFVSHGHRDHCGGIKKFLEKRGRLPVFAPASARPGLQPFQGQADLNWITDSAEILPGFYTTGEMKGIEQSLVVQREGGNAVICGCAHPGVDNILRKAGEYGKVSMIAGGFHGFDKLEMLKDLEIIMPCHCTAHKQKILDMYPDTARSCSSGTTIEL